MVYSVVFWGYANAVMKFGEAKKYYPYLTLAGTLAALIAGPMTIFITGKIFWRLCQRVGSPGKLLFTP